MKKILIRADASTEVGFGHVMRCLALAQALKEAGAEPTFAAEIPEALKTRITQEGFRVIQPGDPTDLPAVAKAEGAEWVVLDGYGFTREDQRVLKEAGLKVLTIDDYGQAEHYHADLILNQNIYADETMYPSKEEGTTLLLGQKFAMLRKEFWPHRNFKPKNPETVQNVLVSFGGGDPHNVTQTAIEALKGVSPEPKVRVIVGASNPHQENLHQALEDFKNAELLEGVEDMAAQYIWADMAILGAGSATWEALFLGVPSILVAFAENQRPVGVEAEKRGLVKFAGWYEDVTVDKLLLDTQDLAANQDKRIEMSAKGQQAIDAHGAGRVANEIMGDRLYVRLVNQRDMKMLWEWKNDPITRAGSFNPDEIPWETHVAWFTKRLTDDDTRICVGEDKGTIVGQSRHRISDYPLEFEDCPPSSETNTRVNRPADSDLIIAPDQRGKGYAYPVFMGATELCFRTGFCDLIFCYIKSANLGSIKPYEKSPYRVTRKTQMHGAEVTEFELTKEDYYEWKKGQGG